MVSYELATELNTAPTIHEALAQLLSFSLRSKTHPSTPSQPLEYSQIRNASFGILRLIFVMMMVIVDWQVWSKRSSGIAPIVL